MNDESSLIDALKRNNRKRTMLEWVSNRALRYSIFNPSVAFLDKGFERFQEIEAWINKLACGTHKAIEGVEFNVWVIPSDAVYELAEKVACPGGRQIAQLIDTVDCGEMFVVEF